MNKIFSSKLSLSSQILIRLSLVVIYFMFNMYDMNYVFYVDSEPNVDLSEVNVSSSDANQNKSPETKSGDYGMQSRINKMYELMYKHENSLLEQEKEVYKATGELPENNYHSKMADLRKNDHLDLAKNVSTEDTSSIEKRDHSDIQTDNDNKDQEKNKRGRNEE
tara:strand:+ start:357 stop:848 length:492 start_codon:yes stop_codon:yes gene_type:complete